MRNWIGMLGLLAVLAACGADGDPVTPGVTLSGDAQIGVMFKP